MTSWNFFDRGLIPFLQTNAMEGKKTLAMVPSLKIKQPRFLMLLKSRAAYRAAVHWVLVRDIATVSEEMAVYVNSIAPIRMSVLARCKRGIGSAFIYSDKLRRPVFLTAQELLDRGSLSEITWRPKQDRFTGDKLVVACTRPAGISEISWQKQRQTHGACITGPLTLLSSSLKKKNVSVAYTHHMSGPAAGSFVIGGQADLLFILSSLSENVLDLFSFADTNIHYDTFYARANDTRSISVFAVLSHSSQGVTLTLLSVVASALLLTSLNCAHTAKSFLRGATRETLFLLASLLATSTPEPRHYRRPWARRAVYASWMTIILSLSVYLRSQMTALVTATKPVDNMDTLEELAKALDAGRVAPVVVAGSSKWDILEKASDHPYSLLRKLNSAYKSHSGAQLVVPTMKDCIRLAGRPDRVCYSAVQPRCMVQKVLPGVEPFQEPMTMMLNGIPLRHGFSYLPALRRLLLAIREGSLARVMNLGCHFDPAASSEHSVELMEFMKHYWLLQTIAAGVFVGECLVHHFLRMRPSRPE
ncbi:hypothetical protein MTO96_017312 [Rhipicephalus appendiculatus]